jgi:ankyrin repeat protein
MEMVLCILQLVTVKAVKEPEVVKQLLHGGANKTVKDKHGKTALDWARSQNHPAVVALLQ